MATPHPLSALDRTDPKRDRRTSTLPPADCWLGLTAPPLDLNGPTAVPYVPFAAGWVERPIFDLFRQVVEQSPDRIAVADSVRQLSYRRIWNGACRLAQTIAARAAIGRPVGILLPDDAHYAVAVLGCLAAARPCVVLDRHYPADRNLAIIRDAGLTAIVVEASERNDEALYPRDIAAIAIDPGMDRHSPLMPPPEGALLPDDPAAIIYTSGSSGEPKGIVLSQRAILHRVGQLINCLHLSAADRLLPLGSPCTIAGIQQVLQALLAGALLVKLDLQRIGFAAVLDTIRDQHVSLLSATPALLRSLARLDGAGDRLGSLRCVHTSGEVLLSADLDLLRRCVPASCGIIVVYGLTEAPGICHWFVPRGVGEEEGARVAVGYPLPGYECAVLDQDERPLGFDETGELVIRSRYTALGEWQGGRAVAGRMRSDPADPSLRTLRTGDLVRVRADGVVVVVGRKDRQVKIRGMRVEPYEIENALRRSPVVLDAAVVARHEGESAILVAFVVLPPEEGEQAIAALRAQLRTSLPPYMQPARIVPIDTLPLLPGHKVDVDALLALDPARPGGAVSAAPVIAGQAQHPRELVAQAWGRIVDRAALAADTPFDQAGGDSLGMLRLLFELEAQCGVMLPLSAFDLSMRPSELARTLGDLVEGRPTARPVGGGEEGTPRSSPLVLLSAGDRAPPVFMAHSLSGIVSELVPLARHLRSRHPVYGLQASGDAIDRIEHIAQNFGEAIEALQPAGPCLLIGSSLGGLIMFQVARRLAQRGREIGLLALLDTYPDRRFWSSRVYMRWWVRRLKHHVPVLSELRPIELIPRLCQLCAAFIKHLGTYLGLGLPPRHVPETAEPALHRLREGLLTAEARYRPQFYPGKLTFVRAETVLNMPDDPIGVWGPLSKEIEVINVPGTHVSILHSETLGAQLSRCLQRTLVGNG